MSTFTSSDLINKIKDYTYAVSKGQGCVFYDNQDQLLGGGWIK